MTTQEFNDIKTLHHEDEIYPKCQSQLKEERFEQLIENSRQEILRQIIGPFGLTPAIFDDKNGGNVTTQHNAEQGIFSQESEELNRKKDYNYNQAKSQIKKQAVQNGTMNSNEFLDRYTGKLEPTKRTNNKGKLVMNAELDHTIPVKEIHDQGGWMRDKKGRDELSSNKENLNYTTFKINRSKGAKTPEEALSEKNGFDSKRIDSLSKQAKKSIEEKLPTNWERFQYHAEHLATAGIKTAGITAFRNALGMTLHEFVNGSFLEIKVLLKERNGQENFIDKLITSLKRVMNRVIGKLKTILSQVIEGGVQGFFSDLLTFLINNFITTSKKIVTLIRESLTSLWRAFELLLNPPEGMTGLEITREVSKIIGVAVTTGFGMMMEESIKGFIMTMPVFIPIANVLATGVTAIMTGLAGALMVYGIDRLFDWLTSNGTELLEAQEAHADAQVQIVERLSNLLDYQFQSSQLYDVCVAEYQQVQRTYSQIEFSLESASLAASTSIDAYQSMADRGSAMMKRGNLTFETAQDATLNLGNARLDAATSAHAQQSIADRGNVMMNRNSSMLETWEAQIERRKRLNAELDAALNAI